MLSNTQTSTSRKLTDYLTTYGLWLGTVILAVYEISLVRNIIGSIYARWLTAPARLSLLQSSANGAAPLR